MSLLGGLVELLGRAVPGVGSLGRLALWCALAVVAWTALWVFLLWLAA